MPWGRGVIGPVRQDVADSASPVGQNGRVPLRIRVALPARRRAAAALAAVAVSAVGLTIALEQNAVAAPPLAEAASAVAAAAPVTTSAGGVSLTVDPAGGLTAGGGSIKVTGSGFKTATGLYVAICHADGKAPASLADCVGGSVPTSNTSNSWGHVTPPGAGNDNSGPVVATWGGGGTFTLQLAYPASNTASDALDCSKVACALYTRGDTGNDQSQDLSVPLVYAAPAPSSTLPVPSSPAAPTTPSSGPVSSAPVVTSTIAGGPTTVQPKIIRSASVRAGGSQEVLFAGFTKGELVTVRLDSTALPAVRADSDGIVKVDFVVPAGTPAGTHLLRVSGRTSRTTGVASFLVTAAPATKPVVSSVAPVSSAPISSAPASAGVLVSSAVIVPPLSSVALSSAPSPVSSAPVPIVGPAAQAPGPRPVWPWYVLGLLVLLLIGVAIVVLQSRRSKLAAEMREKERILAQGAAAEHERALDAIARSNAAAPTAYIAPRPTDQPGGYTGYHPGQHGLLSGRDNPDNPGLLSGQQYRTDATGDLPTTYLPPGAPGAGPGSGTGPGAGAPGRPTGPDSVGPPHGGSAGGPPTGAWTPDFTSGPATAGPSGGGPSNAGPSDGGPGTAQWRPDFGGNDEADGAGADGTGAAGPGADGSRPGPDGDGPGAEPGDDQGGRHSR